MSENSVRPFRILHIDDRPHITLTAGDFLKAANYEVLTANSSKEGLEKAKKEKPDLIILDIMMPGIEGVEVLRQLKASDITKDIPVLVATVKDRQEVRNLLEIYNTTISYVEKPFRSPKVKAQISELLARSTPTFPYKNMKEDCRVTIKCLPGELPSIQATGSFSSVRSPSKTPLAITADRLGEYEGKAAQAYELRSGQLGWQAQSKITGIDLHMKIFQDHGTIYAKYNRAYGSLNLNPEARGIMHLRFESSAGFLRVPLEFLFESEEDWDSPLASGDYTVLTHAVARSVTGVSNAREPLAPMLLNKLYKDGLSLRVLLIASNTLPAIPAVDAEISALAKLLVKLFNKKGIIVECKCVSSKMATAGYVRELLKNNNYHIVHYAGHATYVKNSPEESYLSFRPDKTNKDPEANRIKASELKFLLRESDTRFFYLSCCSGSATADVATLLTDSVLGIADAIVHGGVSAVLGYRWPVDDTRAKDLAIEFYTSLAEHARIDRALLEARKEIGGRKMDDITWISPILIIQDSHTATL